jgi:hypothetical protein
MLERHRTLFLMLGAAMALAATSCSTISGVHETETKFLVQPGGNTIFAGWSEIHVTEDPKSVDSAELLYVRLEAKDTSIPDLTFIHHITGEAKVDETFTLVAQKTAMPQGERIVPLDLVYDGDLRQFFYPENGEYTIHITWRGETNPAYPMPAEGIWMTVKVAVRID